MNDVILEKNKFHKNESGQVLVIGLIVCIALFMVSISVANIGMMVAQKIKLQDTVDASAYSAAVVEARYMNLNAYLNRAMIANYDSMAFNTALWALVASLDHGSAVITDLLYKLDAILFVIPVTTALAIDLDQFIDLIRDYVHHPLHVLDKNIDNFFAQDDESRDMNQYIEKYNTYFLTLYQGLLYASMQASRYDVVKEVAHKIDPDVITTSVLGLGAEAVSYDELAQAIDWVIRDPDSRSFPFSSLNSALNRMAGSAENEDDNPLLLSAVTETSLDKFAAGRDRDGNNEGIRNFGSLDNLIPGVGTIETVLDVACEIVTLSFGDCNSNIEMKIGAALRDGYENKAADSHVPFISRQRIREVNTFGIIMQVSGVPGDFIFNGLLGSKAYTSGEKNNDVGNVANTTFDITEGINFERSIETVLNQGICAIGIPIPTCGLNQLNLMCASTMIAPPLIPPLIVDDHWDGTYDSEPVDSWQVIPPLIAAEKVISYVADVLSEGTEEGVPKYDLEVDIDNVGFGNYIYPDDKSEPRPDGSAGGGEGDLNSFAGPSIAVVGVKPKDKLRGLSGLGIGNEYSMSAISRAQVYYLRNPKRPKERPSSFNPHWVARLAPIDVDGVHPLLRKGLPFIAGVGTTLPPTH